MIAKKKAVLPLAQSGAAHAEASNFDAAIADYDKALAQAPKFVEVWMARGNAYASKGDDGRALDDYARVIKLDPKHAEALFRRGLIFRDKGLLEPAIADFSRVLKLGDNPDVRHTRGTTYLSHGDARKAVADFTAVLKVAPDAPAVLLKRAEAYDKMGEPAKAAADRQAATQAQARTSQSPQAPIQQPPSA